MNEARAAGAWVKSHRLAAGMTQEELAGKSGLSVRAISNLERGRTTRPHPRSLELLAVALGLPESAGAEWATRLRSAQARGASAQARSRPHAVPTTTHAGVADDTEPARLEAAAPTEYPEQFERFEQSEPLERAEPASPSTHQSADPTPGPREAVALAPLAHGDPSRIGPFRLVSRLGGGAMGEVFLAASRAGQPVAVKRVRAEYARDAVFRTRFAKEVAAVRAVPGGHTPALIDADTEAERPWIATAYVPGPSLAQAVDANGALPEPLVLALGGGIAEALAEIHAAGIVHRDLKPSNILLDPDGPKVIDFGISRALDGTALTATGTRVGTAGYTAPELAAHRQTLPAGDVFALGCVLAYAATGVTPFGEGTDAQVLYRVVHEPPDPRALACRDQTLRAVIEACLEKGPEARPTAKAVIEACGGASAPGGSWLPVPLAAQAAAYGDEVARELARVARRSAARRVQFGLVPVLLVLAMLAVVVTLTATKSSATKSSGTDRHAPGASSASSPSKSSAGQVPVRPVSSAVMLGIWTSAEGDGRYSTVAGQRPNVANTYLFWGNSFPTAFADQAESAGATPFVEIEPWQGGGAGDCSYAPHFPAMTTIGANGSAISSYLHTLGSQIASFGHPVIITFAHEFNISGQYPWAQGDCENTTPAQWIQAWDTVRTDINTTAAGLASFMWAPGADTGGTTIDPTPYWPGAPQVDMVGVEGYPDTRWGSQLGTFAGVFGPVFTEIHALTKLPIFIAETDLAPLDGPGYESLAGFISDLCADGGDGVLQLQDSSPLSRTQWSELDKALAGDCGASARANG
ncbi:serine/threonine protein kinase/transcriptional regulator with XRE-family HTH domain [Catenulispora sp. GAS73]|uniref:protein kinase domain-containing protein n=1 Tax=Catenulispora sp. GAS73 TaxID=3156269 RepID=UPI003518F844